ncbi:MAG TPA: GNAT family N-acetyltransferase [Opitutaceae bacterium]|nr:GNAT family N-acetyltransferase [Opitutaceae bacterium]
MIPLRDCRATDFDGVLALLRQLWPTKTIDPEVLRPLFARVLENRRYVCAEEGGRIVGFGGISFRDNLWQEGTIAYVEELVVDEGCRGRGLGQRIMERLLGYAQERGCKRFELDSGFQRPDAHRFYERFGMPKRAYLFSRVLG